jgi:hypothetical protein
MRAVYDPGGIEAGGGKFSELLVRGRGTPMSAATRNWQLGDGICIVALFAGAVASPAIDAAAEGAQVGRSNPRPGARAGGF